MGLVLGVWAGILVLGVFSKNATRIGAYAGFIVSAILVINLKYNHSEVTSWAYSIITILISFVVGSIVSMVHNNIVNIKYKGDAYTYSKDIS